MSLCKAQLWSACAGMHSSASPPHPPPSPALLVHHHFLHPHQACGEEGRRDSLVATEEGEKRETRMRGREGKCQAPSVPTAQRQCCLWGRDAEGGGEGGGDSHLTMALQPLTWLPRPQTLTPLLDGANTWPGARHNWFTVSSMHIRGVSASPPPGAPSPRVCKLMKLMPARVGGTREDGVTLFSLSV